MISIQSLLCDTPDVKLNSLTEQASEELLYHLMCLHQHDNRLQLLLAENAWSGEFGFILCTLNELAVPESSALCA